MAAKRIENLPIGMMFCVVDSVSKSSETHTYYILRSVNGTKAIVDRVFCIGLVDGKPNEMRSAPARGVEINSNIFVLPILQRKPEDTNLGKANS